MHNAGCLYKFPIPTLLMQRPAAAQGKKCRSVIGQFEVGTKLHPMKTLNSELVGYDLSAQPQKSCDPISAKLLM